MSSACIYAEVTVVPLQRIEMDLKELGRAMPRPVKLQDLLGQIRQRGKGKEVLKEEQKKQKTAEDRAAAQRNANYVSRIADKITEVEQTVGRFSAAKAGRILSWSKRVQAAKEDAQKAANRAKESQVGVYVKFALHQTQQAVERATEAAKNVENISGKSFLDKIPVDIDQW